MTVHDLRLALASRQNERRQPRMNAKPVHKVVQSTFLPLDLQPYHGYLGSKPQDAPLSESSLSEDASAFHDSDIYLQCEQ